MTRCLGWCGILLHLLPDPLHVDVERLRIAEIACAPDLLDEEVAREEPTLPPEERLEQLELLGREPDGLAPDEHLVLRRCRADTGPPLKTILRVRSARIPARRRCARTLETSSRTENGFVT